MIERLRENWREFRESKPGCRFQDRYRRLKEHSKRGRFNPLILFYLVAGVALVLFGLVMVPAPGPGWVIVLFGLALIAGEVRPLARLLDWIELRLRKLASWAVDFWRGCIVLTKSLIVAAAVACAGGVFYGCYYLYVFWGFSSLMPW